MKQTKNVKKVVLAYSGGLDTSVIIPWLKENYGCEVIAMTAQLGQKKDLEQLRQKALKSGASKIYIEDMRREFIEDYIFPTLKAGAVYERKYLLGTSFARPLIAKRQIEIAAREGADAVAHGCTGKGNDQVRFELAYKALNPKIKIIAPWREWEIRSREEEIEYAQNRGIPVSATKEENYSRDRNIWHLSHEGGALEDPETAPPTDLFQITASPEEAPDKPTVVDIEFEEGVPRKVDGESLDPVELLERLNELGAQNGIGRVDLVENRLVGIKSRGVYETPGGTLLYVAHSELENLTLDRDTLHYKDLVAQKYAELVYFGKWFTPLKQALDAFVDVTQRDVTGLVRLRLYKGNCIVVKRTSPYSLYRKDLATFGEESVYDQRDATGFITLFGLPEKVRALRDIEQMSKDTHHEG
ncbi:MAG: argininosuccinate synthase [Candidatus Latescibacterota bacterium]|nr:MAG: argininosuccinate synthase [Candidatus Latescibacterota bacterium]